MRLNFSRYDVSFLLDLIKTRQNKGKVVGLVERNQLSKLSNVLSKFRDSVWGDTTKEDEQ